MSRMLEGVKVLDFTINVAGPSATAMLGDQGATVIKIERPVRGDDGRYFAPCYGNACVEFWWCDRNKKSVTVDLTDPEGVAFIKKIAADADIACESFRPGVMDRLGLGYEDLRKVNPRLVYCSVSAFGQSGENSNKPGYDLIAQALSGVIDLTGPKNGPAVKVGPYLGDYAASLNAYAGMITAYLHASKTGEGQHVDVALLDGLIGFNSSIEVASVTGRNITRNGNHAGSLCPYGLFEAAGGRSIVLATASNALWIRLCEAMGQPELSRHPSYETNDLRVAHEAEVVSIIETWLQSFDDVEEPLRILEQHSIPSCKVRTTRETMEDPELAERGTIVELAPPLSLQQDGMVPVKARGPWIKYSATPSMYDVAPDLGQHNEEIMENYGYSPEEIKTLQSKWAGESGE